LASARCASASAAGGAAPDQRELESRTGRGLDLGEHGEDALGDRGRGRFAGTSETPSSGAGAVDVVAASASAVSWLASTFAAASGGAVVTSSRSSAASARHRW